MAREGRIAAIGERVRVAGLALAGVRVLTAEGPDAVRAAWRDLPYDVELVILTPSAARALDLADSPGPQTPPRSEGDRPLTAVMPP